MTHTTEKSIDQNTRRLRFVAWGMAAILMSLPLMAMPFSREVNWTGSDFVIFGAMLLAACAGFELALRFMRQPAHRLLAGLSIAGLFVLVWAELAVGIFH